VFTEHTFDRDHEYMQTLSVSKWTQKKPRKRQNITVSKLQSCFQRKHVLKQKFI